MTSARPTLLGNCFLAENIIHHIVMGRVRVTTSWCGTAGLGWVWQGLAGLGMVQLGSYGDQMSDRYLENGGSSLKRGSRSVLIAKMVTDFGVVFRCPCDEREVYVASPPHEISFDEDGALTLDGSVGSRADPSRDRPAKNWCHFHIKAGDPTMCDDSQCPGAGLMS